VSSVKEENLQKAAKAAPKAMLPPRERILDAACELFYSRGIRCVSVDEIAAAAQTNKMTLYRHFESKDQLVAEYLKSLWAWSDADFDEAMRPHAGDSCAQLRAWVERVGERFAMADDRGCPMANAAIELPEKDHPARAVIEDYKARQCEKLVGLCRESGFDEPERLAEEIFLLYEGACANVQSVGRGGPAKRFPDMVCALLKSRARHKEKV
jgi:AcrR family transcriptional regulator